MAWDRVGFEKKVTTDPTFRQLFYSDPMTALKQFGLEITVEAAGKIKAGVGQMMSEYPPSVGEEGIPIPVPIPPPPEP